MSVSGTRDGIPVGPKDRVGNTFETMEFTDGLNELFFGGQYRWILARWTPYVGLGVGPAFPHVEVRRAPRRRPIRTPSTISSTASTVEGLVGVEYHFGPRFSVFGDYKLSFATNDADLVGGGSLETDVWTNHVTFGVVLPFRRGAGPGRALLARTNRAASGSQIPGQ